MPPKVSRGLGRGRGRGRGSAAPTRGRKDSEAQDEPSSRAETLTSTPPTEQPPAHTTPLLTLQKQQDVSPNPSPNSSPASAPTETPAPTPARAPIQRLDSLLGVGRGILGARGVSKVAKFKPKAVRRSIEERERAQKEEQERMRQRELAAQRAQGIATTASQGFPERGGGRGDRGRGRGRGRGDAMGMGGLDRNNKVLREASGLFGIAPAGAERKPASVPSGGGWRRDESSGGGSGGTWIGSTATASGSGTKAMKVKQEPGSLSHMTIDEAMGGESYTNAIRIKSEIPEPIYPEEQEEGSHHVPRVDIELINLVTDDEDDDPDVVDLSRSKGKGRVVPYKGGLRPVRLHREEHKERVTIVNTEPAATPLTKDLPGLGEDGDDDGETIRRGHLDFSRDGKQWSGAWERENEVHVKYDPGAPTDAMDLDMDRDGTTQDTDFNVPTEHLVGQNEPTATSSNLEGKSKSLRKSSNIDKQPIFQTEEDRAEYNRHMEDVEILARELGGLQRFLATETADGVLDGHTEMNSEHRQVKDKEGRLYLFQFPPILPPLHNQIKREEAMDGDMDIIEVQGAPSAPAEAIDLTKPDNEEVVIKVEPGQSSVFQSPPQLVKEEGSVGTLVVRESGKVELNWGGTILQIGRGVESAFLTTTIIVDGVKEECQQENVGLGYRKASASTAGTGTAMGRVMGKFVATPDWAQMIEME